MRSLFAFLACVAVVLYLGASYFKDKSFRRCFERERLARDTILPWKPPLEEKNQLDLASTGRLHQTNEHTNVFKRRMVEIPKMKKTKTKNKKCKKVKHVLFLKTHKTGSSTITNILNRFADKWNLTVALPKPRNQFTFLWPTRFRLSYTAPLYKIDVNILCNHARYNRKPMHWLFPKSRAKYITILRNPVKQYESVFNFMHFANVLGFGREADPLGTFLKYPPSFKDTHPLMKKTLALHLLRNPMLFDLGLDFRYFQNMSAIVNYIDYLDNEFDLVMVMDHFDESLVLLKQVMCWSFEDILYFKLNERLDQHKKNNLNESVKQGITSWNRADVVLYDYFNKTLWRKIKAQGESFDRELKIFRKINSRISNKCLQKGKFLDEAYTGVYVKGYSLRADIPETLKKRCENMKTNEILYEKRFRKKMDERIMEMEEPEEYLDDPLNDWDTATDLEYVPTGSGYESVDYPQESSGNVEG